MTQVLNFILHKLPISESEFLEICPDGGALPPCDLRVDPDYWGVPEPIETYGDLEVVNCPMESLTAKCGAEISVWMRPGCPPDTPDVVCDAVQNPADIASDSSETIYILDGYPPYEWEIVGGHGYSLEWETTGDLGGRPDERLNSINTLYSDTDSCGTAQVKITDNCLKEVICEIPNSSPSTFEYDWVNSGQTVARNSNTTIFVTGGVPPYTWNISGTGFAIHSVTTYSGENTVYASSGACGGGVITVEDKCDFQTEGSIRCSNGGGWVLVEHTNYGDVACGAMRGVGVDFHNTWSLICDGAGCFESWRGKYHVEEIAEYNLSFWYGYPYTCADCNCDYWVPGGCVLCLTNNVPTCNYCQPKYDAGTLPCCYNNPKWYCVAVYQRRLDEWKCP